MATQQGGYEVWTDEDRDVLYLRLTGSMNERRLSEARAAVVEQAETLSEPFDIVNDISELDPQSPEEAEQVKRGQSQLADLGVGDVVRVVDEDTSELVKMTFSVGSSEAGYEGNVAPSIEAAESMLD